MAWTDHPKITAVRQRSRFGDVMVETLAGFSRHLTGRNGAVLTYYGFLTLFPLFLAASTILGFVLESEPEWQVDLVDSAASQIPFIGDDIVGGSIGGSWWGLIIGLLAALWGSTKAFVGLQLAYDDTWEIDLDGRASFVTQRGRALIGLAAIGLSQIANVALAAIVSQAGLPRIGQIAIILGGLAINAAVVGTMYRYLTSAQVTWHDVWPGTVFTATMYTAIQFAGTAAITALQKSAETYGEFVAVISLLSWLSLHAIINLFGAEINAALDRLRGRHEHAVELDSPMIEAPLTDA